MIVAHLMADYPLDMNPLFFGQFSIIRDFAVHWKTARMPDGRTVAVDHVFIGSRVSGPQSVRTSDPTIERDAYAEAIGRIGSRDSYICAFSHFIHKDATALRGLMSLRRERPDFRLVVLLHCTRDEFLRTGNGTARSEPRLGRQLFRARAFEAALLEASSEGGVDRFAAVSHSTRDTYVDASSPPHLPPAMVDAIPNGVDTRRYRIPRKWEREGFRRETGLTDGFVVGCTNRWTRVKGSDILEALLDRLERTSRFFPVTFLYPLLVHDRLFEFLKAAPRRYPVMFQSGRIRGFADISSLDGGPFRCSADRARSVYDRVISEQPSEVRAVVKRTFIGFLRRPAYWLMDAYLRPSIAEAYGLGIVEAQLCGVPALGSDRGGCRELIPPEHRIRLTDLFVPPDEAPLGERQKFHRGVERAADGLFDRLRHVMEFRPDPEALRSRMIKAGTDTGAMISGYESLVAGLYQGD